MPKVTDHSRHHSPHRPPPGRRPSLSYEERKDYAWFAPAASVPGTTITSGQSTTVVTGHSENGTSLIAIRIGHRGTRGGLEGYWISPRPRASQRQGRGEEEKGRNRNKILPSDLKKGSAGRRDVEAVKKKTATTEGLRGNPG